MWVCKHVGQHGSARKNQVSYTVKEGQLSAFLRLAKGNSLSLICPGINSCEVNQNMTESNQHQ